MSRYSSRKFMLALLALTSCSWLVWEKAIAASDYKAVVIGTVGAYIIGNVAQAIGYRSASPDIKATAKNE